MIAPLAYSSCTANARSVLSMEMRVKRVAASTVAVESSESGFATVAMLILLEVRGARV